MENLLLLAVCIVLFIIQIIMLHKSIKKKEKKYWTSSFCLELLSIAMLSALLYYYVCLAPRGGFMSGVAYFGEELTCLGAGLLYIIMLCITAIARMAIVEKSQKLEGKKSVNPLRLMIAFIFLLIGIICLFSEVVLFMVIIIFFVI